MSFEWGSWQKFRNSQPSTGDYIQLRVFKLNSDDKAQIIEGFVTTSEDGGWVGMTPMPFDDTVPWGWDRFRVRKDNGPDVAVTREREKEVV